jgi:hypothetical protein
MGKNETLELAEEHVKIAQQLLNEESKKCQDRETCSPKKTKALIRGQFELEKAEAEIEDAESDENKKE